ncbi:ABC transporter substrate-binding protein [Shinella sumterensis]|uniref:Thiamine pyrimidine synthase n=1 Tax=Shinella sumterensis TaxID=1967501 RepID=A0AA50CR15_9HYPH|nr:ABC transporter substrate-binding protein [Shinella sumterensis]WLS00316.1 ABC transporter substrate-binding protein [Shinella sumterensis]
MSMTLTRRSFAAAAMALAAMIAMPQKTFAQDLTKLTFIQEWPVPDGFWIPWILGSKKGFYAEEGLEIEIVTPPTVADTMKFLGTGQAQVAFTTVMDVIFAKEQQAPVVAIGRYGRSNNWGILSPEGKPLTIADLKGKTIGIYNDAWTLAQLSIMLADGGMTIDDVKTVAASDDTVPLLLQNRVDAITGITNAEGTGMLTTGGQKAEFLPATAHGVPNTPIFMLAANEPWLKENPEKAKAFLRATRKSIEYAVANPEEAIAAFAELYAKAYDGKFIDQQWKDTIPLFGAMDASLMVNDEADWTALLAALKKFDVVKKIEAPSAYYTNDYIAQ